MLWARVICERMIKVCRLLHQTSNLAHQTFSPINAWCTHWGIWRHRPPIET